MNTNDKMIVFSEDFIEKVEHLGKRILEREQRNSQKKTPKSRIKTKGQFETGE